MSDEDIISWSPNYSLKFSDFQKDEDFGKSVVKGRNRRDGFSYVLYDLDFKLKFSNDKRKFMISKIKLETQFDRKKSYFNKDIVKNKNWSKEKMDYWILHEQGHFDLHEEIKIKMENKIISRCKGIVFDTNGSTETEIEKNAYENASKFIQPIYNEISLKDAQKIQNFYDEETNHSLNVKKQIQYNQHFKRLRQIANIRKQKKSVSQNSLKN